MGALGVGDGGVALDELMKTDLTFAMPGESFDRKAGARLEEIWSAHSSNPT